MSSIFTRIVNGELPAYKLTENENYLAFLDVFPIAKGHVLVIPKVETDYIFDLDDEAYKGLMLFAKIVATALKKAVPCKRIGVAVIGLEIPHAHVHLVPLNNMGDIDFTKPKLKFSPEELETLRQSIVAQL